MPVLRNKKIKWLLIIIFIVVFCGIDRTFADNNNKQNTTIITLISEGIIEANPDTATFQFDVISSSSKVNKSFVYNKEKITKVINALQKLGIKNKYIKTVGYSIYPYDNYISNRLEVTVKPAEKVGEIIESLLNLDIKGDIKNISRVNFIIKQKEKLKKYAYKKALKSAKINANYLAKNLGAHIDKVISIKEVIEEPNYKYFFSKPYNYWGGLSGNVSSTGYSGATGSALGGTTQIPSIASNMSNLYDNNYSDILAGVFEIKVILKVKFLIKY